MQYHLEKSLWSDVDFENMGWHDCPIYAVSFGQNFELLLDIDYIFEWVLKGKKYKFWTSPCTLVFENVYDVKFDLAMITSGLVIDNVIRENPGKPRNADYIKRDIEFDWTIETFQGPISFKSAGFRQFVRGKPLFLGTQAIGLKERGGISFDLKG